MANEEPQALSWNIPKIPVAHNKVLRQHWAVRRKDAQDWKILCRAYCGLPHFNPLKLDEKITLEITVRRVRLQDPDNSVASLKPLIDAIRRLGWLKDDNEDCLRLITAQEKCRKDEEGTRILWIRGIDKGKLGDDNK